MSWPISQDYNEAVQNPGSSFLDPELRSGEVVTNAMGLPMPRSGNFADVYEYQGASGSKWAVKCFTRDVGNLALRYNIISTHLSLAQLPFTVEFQFLDQGIRIRGQWYPVLKMQWVEGLLLNEFVRDNLDKPALLQGLLQIWNRMGSGLRKAGIAHADLQHGNIILIPGVKKGSLAVKLIDYDGMFVPALARMPSSEVGHASYQHPLRAAKSLYNLEVDRFPLLAIACALRALSVAGRPLWTRFDNGDNLLFQSKDFRNPSKSELLRELWNIEDAQTHDLVGNIVLALVAPLEKTPLLNEIIRPEGSTLPLQPAQEDWVRSVLGKGATIKRNASQSAMPILAVQPKGPVQKAEVPVPSGIDQNPSDFPMDLTGQIPKRNLRKKSRLLFYLAGTGALLLILMLGGIFYWNSKPELKVAQEKPEKITGKGSDARSSEKPPLPEKEKVPTPIEIKVKPEPEEVPTTIETKAKEEAGDILTNSIGMRMAFIPKGKLMRGSPASEKYRNPNEGPRHEVTLTKDFYLGVFEVTQEEYEKVMGVNPSKFKGPKLPVEMVSWDEAKEFCKKLSEIEGKLYTLPTEAEWEYACRAGTMTPYHFGEILTTKDANFPGSRLKRTEKVGSYPPNAWGLYDMHGNVYEWCEDWAEENEYKGKPSDPVGPSLASNRVIRGGSWFDNLPGHSRSAFRGWGHPSTRRNDFGFRVSLKVEGQADSLPMDPIPIKEIKNSIGMRVVYIPAGKFRMGSLKNEQDQAIREGADKIILANEGPQHEVELTKGFFLGKFAVTQEEYQKIMGKNPSRHSKGDTRRYPVEDVSWEDAKEFCQKLSAMEGKAYRLPTEAEWEYACRAGKTTAFHFGNTLTLNMASFSLNRRIMPVGSFPANAWGLHDMHGNVWQWCEDWYAVDTYKRGNCIDPKGPISGTERVFRGGCWGHPAHNCRSAFRYFTDPAGRNWDMGFRIVLELDDPAKVKQAPDPVLGKGDGGRVNVPQFVNTPSGLRYAEIKIGTGKQAKAADTVTVKYTGTLRDCKQFDSNIYAFQIGKARELKDAVGVGPDWFIKCWDQAVFGMKEDGMELLKLE